jgi:hypothetical protein
MLEWNLSIFRRCNELRFSEARHRGSGDGDLGGSVVGTEI